MPLDHTTSTVGCVSLFFRSAKALSYSGAHIQSFFVPRQACSGWQFGGRTFPVGNWLTIPMNRLMLVWVPIFCMAAVLPGSAWILSLLMPGIFDRTLAKSVLFCIEGFLQTDEHVCQPCVMLLLVLGKIDISSIRQSTPGSPSKMWLILFWYTSEALPISHGSPPRAGGVPAAGSRAPRAPPSGRARGVRKGGDRTGRRGRRM